MYRETHKEILERYHWAKETLERLQRRGIPISGLYVFDDRVQVEIPDEYKANLPENEGINLGTLTGMAIKALRRDGFEVRNERSPPIGKTS